MLRKYLFFLPLVFLAATALFFLTQTIRNRNVADPEFFLIDRLEDSRGLGYTGQRKIVRDKLGDFYVAYRKDLGGNAEIFVAKLSTLSGQARISGTEKPLAKLSEKNEQRVPSIAIDTAGNLHATWYGSDSPGQKNNRQIKYARSTDSGTTWSSWRNISYVAGFTEGNDLWQEHPSIFVAKDQSLYIVWEGKDGQNRQQQIKISRSKDGGNSWSHWENVKEVSAGAQSRPSLTEDSRGNLYLFMYSAAGNQTGESAIQYSSSADHGESWSQWQILSDPRFDARHASIAADKSGNIHVAWRQPAAKDGPSQIFFRSLLSGRWSKPVRVSASPQWHFFPSISTDEKGKLFVSWMESPGPSDFPKENPTQGKVFLVKFDMPGQTGISLPKEIGDGTYPSLPEKITDSQNLSLVLTRPNQTGKTDLFLYVLVGSWE